MRNFLLILLVLTSCTKDDKEIFYYNCDCRTIYIEYINGVPKSNPGIVYKLRRPLAYKINQDYGLIFQHKIINKNNYITDTFISDMKKFYYIYGSFDSNLNFISFNTKFWNFNGKTVQYDSCDCRR